MKILLESVSKKFGKSILFQNISLTFNQGSYAINGKNGEGKTSLLKLIAGISLPDQGRVIYSFDNLVINPGNWYHYITFAAPYIDFPESLSIKELLKNQIRIKPLIQDITITDFLELSYCDVYAEKTFASLSTGMKQQFRIALAVLSAGSVVLLDEPMSNLDEENIKHTAGLIKRFCNNRVLIICTNNHKDELLLCKEIIQLSSYKPKNIL